MANRVVQKMLLLASSQQPLPATQAMLQTASSTGLETLVWRIWPGFLSILTIRRWPRTLCGLLRPRGWRDFTLEEDNNGGLQNRGFCFLRNCIWITKGVIGSLQCVGLLKVILTVDTWLSDEMTMQFWILQWKFSNHLVEISWCYKIYRTQSVYPYTGVLPLV